jgi:hypothetical protein
VSLRGTVRRGATLRAAASMPMLCVAVAAAACGPPQPRPQRVWTESYEFRIAMEPLPPPAREPIAVTVVALDKETRELISGGEGRIFATSADSANTWDSFTPAAEPGVYRARLSFVHAGQWRISLQFRRDSTARLEKPADDMVQMVRAQRPIGERAFPEGVNPSAPTTKSP